MNVLIIDPFTPEFLTELAKLPVNYTYLPDIKPAEVPDLLPSCEVLILNSKIRLDREVIDRATQLRLVLRAGVGMDHLDMAYLEEKGIIALNAQGGNADAVGEQSIGMLLALLHNIVRADRQVRSFQWLREANRGRELKGKTVGIIGYGHTGSAVGRKLAGFGCRVIAYDKYKQDFGGHTVEEVSLAYLMASCDILSLHVPLTDETRHWINDEFLAALQRPVVLLNLARGPVVDLYALRRALDQGQVLAAGLDVLENEKFNTLGPELRALYEDLFSRDNVIFTPHIGGWTQESRRNINDLILSHLRAYCEAGKGK